MQVSSLFGSIWWGYTRGIAAFVPYWWPKTMYLPVWTTILVGMSGRQMSRGLRQSLALIIRFDKPRISSTRLLVFRFDRTGNLPWFVMRGPLMCKIEHKYSRTKSYAPFLFSHGSTYGKREFITTCICSTDPTKHWPLQQCIVRFSAYCLNYGKY